MSPRNTILTIEDDSAIRRGIVDALEFHGFQVIESAEGTDGKRQAIEGSYDLLLLDLGLPGRSGLEILRAVRQLRPTQPVIILTAKGDEADRVQGLRDGADDYVVKPFSVKELLARIEAVLRRTSMGRNHDETEFAHGLLDFARRELRYYDGTRAELSEREAELLRYLVTNSGRAISRDEILASVWPTGASRPTSVNRTPAWRRARMASSARR